MRIKVTEISTPCIMEHMCFLLGIQRGKNLNTECFNGMQNVFYCKQHRRNSAENCTWKSRISQGKASDSI